LAGDKLTWRSREQSRAPACNACPVRDRHGQAWRLIHTGSFFKSLVPALRVGCIVAEPDLLARVLTSASKIAAHNGPNPRRHSDLCAGSEQIGRHGKAECLDHLQVDDKLDLG